MPFIRPTAGLPAWRSAMSANTWTALASSGTLAAINPENNAAINPNGAGNAAPWAPTAGAGAQHAVIDAWSSAVYDDATQTMFIGPAGGHDDYWGNERYKCDLSAAAPAWTLIANPTGAIGNTGTVNDANIDTGVYFDGRPRANHTYNFPVWVPGVGQILPVISATSAGSGAASKVFLIDRAGATSTLHDYSALVRFASTTTIPTGASIYDPVLDSVLTVIAGGSYILRFQLGSVTSLLNMPGLAATGTGCTAAVFLPNVHAILYIATPGSAAADAASNGLTLIKITTLSQTQLTATGSFASGLGVATTGGGGGVVAGQLASAQACAGAQWDSIRNRLLLWHQTSNTTVISTLTPGVDYFSNTWTRGSLTVSASNSVTPTVASPNGTYGRFAFSRSLDGVFLINGVSEATYFYAFS